MIPRNTTSWKTALEALSVSQYVSPGNFEEKPVRDALSALSQDPTQWQRTLEFVRVLRKGNVSPSTSVFQQKKSDEVSAGTGLPEAQGVIVGRDLLGGGQGTGNRDIPEIVLVSRGEVIAGIMRVSAQNQVPAGAVAPVEHTEFRRHSA